MCMAYGMTITSFYGMTNTLDPPYIFIMIFQRNASLLAPDLTCSNKRALVFHSSYSTLSPKPHRYVNSLQLIACLIEKKLRFSLRFVSENSNVNFRSTENSISAKKPVVFKPTYVKLRLV